MAGEDNWPKTSDSCGWKESLNKRYGPRAHEVTKMEQQRVVRIYGSTMEVNTIYLILVTFVTLFLSLATRQFVSLGYASLLQTW